MENRNTTFEADRPIEPGVKIIITERNSNGNTVGLWQGYYSDEKGTIKLYPCSVMSCWWGVPRVVHTISARLVRVKRSTAVPEPKKPAQPKKESIPRGFWKLPLAGQERMDI